MASKTYTEAKTLHRVEGLRGPSVDSYDKLIAWLAEMAENDNVHLDTSVFVSHLNSVCGGSRDQTNCLSVSRTSVGGATAGGGGSSSGESSSKRSPNIRENSASYDSHASSERLTHRHQGSTRSDDFLDPKSAWKSGVNSRQTTFSDDLEEEIAEDMKKISMESLYSSADRDSELGSLMTYHNAFKRCGKVYNTVACTSLLHAATPGRYPVGPHVSSSMGNLLSDNNDDDYEYRQQPPSCPKRRSVSLLNLKPPISIKQTDNVPKLVLTKEEDDVCQTFPVPMVEKKHRKKPKSVQKSLSLYTWTRRKAKLEKQMSLQVESNPSSFYPLPDFNPTLLSRAASATAAVAAALEIPAPEAPVFLDDALLDGNLADILYCVEALWPKK
ncbi:hypothetical protein Btru_074300 [Bulinus truncatus]|nr:hypothetical protein Btru_074300 [Bulinus truncatus]